MNTSTNNVVSPDFEKLISNPNNWIKFQSLLNAAASIVGEFDTFDDIQLNENGVEDSECSIGQLRDSLRSLNENFVKARE